LTARHVRLSLGGSVYDPDDAVGRLLFNVLAMIAEFEAALIRLRTKEGMRVANAKGRLRGRKPKLNTRQEAHLDGRRRAQHIRGRRPVRGQPPHRLPRHPAQQERSDWVNPHRRAAPQLSTEPINRSDHPSVSIWFQRSDRHTRPIAFPQMDVAARRMRVRPRAIGGSTSRR
jgi:hypothetical protein